MFIRVDLGALNHDADLRETCQDLIVPGVAPVQNPPQEKLQPFVSGINAQSQQMELVIPFPRLHAQLDTSQTIVGSWRNHFNFTFSIFNFTFSQELIHAVAVVVIGKCHHIKIPALSRQFGRRKRPVARRAMYMQINHHCVSW